MFKAFYLTLFFCALFSSATAQHAFDLKIELSDSILNEKSLRKLINAKHKISSGAERNKKIQNLLLAFYEKGYLAATIDSLVHDSLYSTCYITAGPTYKWARLSPGNVNEGMLSIAGFREKVYFNKQLHFNEVENLSRKLLEWSENNGFPFASFKLDSLKFSSSNTIEASLNLQKNKEIRIDSIVIRGNAKINPVYFYNYIGIKPGDLYDESKVKKLTARIKELPFLKETRSFEISFSESVSKLVFFLDHNQASQFDGVLGVLPNNDIPGKILLTGDLQLKLLNSFGSGELIDLNWRKLQDETQDLKAQFTYPFVFSTPFGIDAKLDLYKKDTTFLNVNSIIGIQYILSGGNYFKVFMNTKNSIILSDYGLEFLSQLPQYADVKTILYGIGYKNEHLDYRLNPRKGHRFILNGAAGNRKILKNPKIKEELYENLALKTVQYDLNLAIDYFIPLSKRSTLKLSNSSSYLISPSAFENELYRIGGLKTLRGFDEESILASSFSMFTVEARYLLEQNSYAHVFWNGAWYENNTMNKFVTDTPWGFGAGMSFETKAGIFSLNYALGKQFNQNFQLRTGKIHFGIVNYF
ncbi:MAG: BamA/TamA family outer membrane protein [Bacteroidetes bacterium]|nr:BamA/TamA family outer membrane protein [Bacteroidota bacterium]HET6245830.1 BamA/TamA family outer membrane protein [Bacteroidia bacterium]